MNEDNIQDIIKTRFSQLPPEVQKAITATDLSVKLDQVSKKYSLRIDQAGDLETETLLIMLGLEPAEDFVANIRKNLDVSKEISEAIAHDVNSEVLGGIRTNLMQIQAQEEKEEMEAQEKTESRTREHVLNSIENPSVNNSKPINILEEYPMVVPGQTVHPTLADPLPITNPTTPTPIPPTINPAKAPQVSSLNMLDRFMSAPVSVKNETVETKVAETKPAGTIFKTPPPKARVPGSPDRIVNPSNRKQWGQRRQYKV